MDPYPPATRERITSLAELRIDGVSSEDLAVTGRVAARRRLGGVEFVDLRDGAHTLQLLLARDVLDSNDFDAWQRCVQVGDVIIARGRIVTTRTGQLSLEVRYWELSTKGRRVVGPETAAGRGRHATPRYVEMIRDASAVERVLARSQVLGRLRQVMAAHGFVEVDTPLLQPHRAGQSAPFESVLNSWGSRVFLRNTAEPYLKRLMVGGLDRIFEVGRCFRNEAVDSLHFPEFTVLEVLRRQSEYTAMSALAEDLIRAAYGGLPVPAERQPSEQRLPEERFARETFFDLLSQTVGVQLDAASPRETLTGLAALNGVKTAPDASTGAIVMRLYRRLVVPVLSKPTFVLDLPLEAAITARATGYDDRLAEAWFLVIDGMELAQGSSELTDPDEHRRRQAERVSVQTAGPLPPLDEELLQMLEVGLPPCGGFAVGLERLLMTMFRGTHILDYHSHPILKPGPNSGSIGIPPNRTPPG